MTMKDEWKGPQEEEYSFLQEVIKNEAGSKKAIKKKVLNRIGFGFVFGIVACFTFFASKSFIESQFPEDPQTVTIPADEEDEAAEEKEEPQAQDIGYRQMLQKLKNVVAETEKSLVEITGQENWETESAEDENTISGTIVADNGKELLILANDSLVKSGKNIQVTFNDGSNYPAEMKKRDENLGLCIYAVNRAEISKDTWEAVETAELGSSNAMSVGDMVIVLGQPFGSDKATGYGTIIDDNNLVEAADGNYRLISTDISCYGDGSGVIANENGEIIGILNQTSRKDGEKSCVMGYAVSDIKSVIEFLSNGKGVPYIGIYAVDVTEEMQEKGLPAGSYVKEVEADSPAMEAGIQSGDIITRIDDVEITTYKGYYNHLMNQEKGKDIVIKGLRSGGDKEYVEIEFHVKIGSKE